MNNCTGNGNTHDSAEKRWRAWLQPPDGQRCRQQLRQRDAAAAYKAARASAWKTALWEVLGFIGLALLAGTVLALGLAL